MHMNSIISDVMTATSCRHGQVRNNIIYEHLNYSRFALWTRPNVVAVMLINLNVGLSAAFITLGLGYLVFTSVNAKNCPV